MQHEAEDDYVRSPAKNDEEAASDDEMEWDEVTAPSAQSPVNPMTDDATTEAELAALHQDLEDKSGTENQPLNIVLERAQRVTQTKKRTAASAEERMIRYSTHQLHTVALLASGLVRNRLLSDRLLKARLLSLIPMNLATAFVSFSPRTHPCDRDRARLFDTAMRDLVSWWWNFFTIDDSRPRLSSQTWAEAEDTYDEISANKRGQKRVDLLMEHGEPIHTSKSLMKRAIIRKGSRDVSAQLFTAVCRALSIPARLVCSLQPVTWKGAGSGGKAVDQDPAANDEVKNDDSVETRPAAKGKAPPLKGTAEKVKKPRKMKPIKTPVPPKPKKRKMDDLAALAYKNAKRIQPRRSVTTNGRDHQLPTTGSEDDGAGSDFEDAEASGSDSNSDNQPEASLSDNASDVIPSKSRSSPKRRTKSLPKTKVVRAPIAFRSGQAWDKSPSPGPREAAILPAYWTEVYSRPGKEWYGVDVTRKKTRCQVLMEPRSQWSGMQLSYVVAYEQDGYVRDITPKYARSYGGFTIKNRMKVKNADWFTGIIQPYKRPYKLARDLKEDEDIEKAHLTEPMPTNIGGFKDHPNYALERHLKREEAIYPRRQLGVFRGEPVFPRSSVVALKSAQNYLREGKRVKGNEEPLKEVKPRVVTISRRRELEAAKAEGREEVQGLYAEWQVELLIPPPIKDGIIPRNEYGNIDLFAPHMLPAGAVHLAYKGMAKIAKKLGVSYAEAVVGFEFHKRRAAPTISGIVIPEADKVYIWDAYWASEEAAHEKELTKLQERSLKRWKKIILGLKIRQRLKEDYKHRLQNIKPHPVIGRRGKNELQALALDDEEKGTHVKQAREAVPELYTDHQVNTLSMSQKMNPKLSSGVVEDSESEVEEVKEVVEKPKALKGVVIAAKRTRASQSPQKTRKTKEESPEEIDVDNDDKVNDEAVEKPKTSRVAVNVPKRTRASQSPQKTRNAKQHSPEESDVEADDDNVDDGGAQDAVEPLKTLKPEAERTKRTRASQSSQKIRKAKEGSPEESDIDNYDYVDDEDGEDAVERQKTSKRGENQPKQTRASRSPQMTRKVKEKSPEQSDIDDVGEDVIEEQKTPNRASNGTRRTRASQSPQKVRKVREESSGSSDIEASVTPSKKVKLSPPSSATRSARQQRSQPMVIIPGQPRKSIESGRPKRATAAAGEAKRRAHDGA